MKVSLGPFDVLGELARGGMGVVLRAVHRAQNEPVAVKVISELAAGKPSYYEDFRREVVATARLTHPNIVALLDYGTIPPAAEQASDGLLATNSPFLVMELADCGSLADHPPKDWPSLRLRLHGLLDALSHAHANGLTHRDLKPANVLLHGAGRGEPIVKLVDFGIAHASDRRAEGGADLEQLSGTPYYMAPEQVECRWRDYGPWTDLYALGIMVWELVCGGLPFVAPTPIGVLLKHVTDDLPAFAPRYDVPSGLSEWIEQLCRKQYRSRFQRAADAKEALRSLDHSHSFTVVTGSATVVQIEDAATAPTLITPGMGLPPLAPRITATPPAAAPQRAAIVQDWRVVEERPSRRLLGAGLGLYFVRTVPLVDRETERDALWSLLRRVDADGRARAVVLRGPSGTGKSRLASWLCERAHESGAAIVLQAMHEESPGPAHGLSRMVALHHRAVGLCANDVRKRLANDGVQDPCEMDVLTTMLAVDEPDEEGRRSGHFASPMERYIAVEGVLTRAARERAVLVWLDDAQWGGDSLGLVEHALAHLETRVLFVITVRDEALPEREREKAQLESIEAKERAESLRLGPLSERDTAMLIENLLGLSGVLARRIRSRAGGNPLFAVQLVGGWIARGVLQVTPEGFALGPGERSDLPDDLHTVWIDRVERVLAGRSSDDRVLVELAAILGLDVDAAELDAVCALRGSPFLAELAEVLVRAHLIERTEAGFRFAHGMLRESLIRSAVDAGRAPALHRACTLMLQARSGRGSAGRRGIHLMFAEQYEDALEPLLESARELRDESDYTQALAMLGRREEALVKANISDRDERWGLGWVLRADVHRLEWDFAAAQRWATNALSTAEKHNWQRVRAEALAVLAHCSRQQGDLVRAQDQNRQALGLFTRLDDEDGRARTLLAMAIVARQQGDFERAEGLYSRAYAIFELCGDERGAGNAMLGLGHVARHAKDYTNAEIKYQQARARFESAGYRTGIADCLMGIGDVVRYRGDLTSAEAAYREAERLQRATGSQAAVIARLNLGLVVMGQDRYHDARAIFESELVSLEREGKGAYIALVHTILLPCLVADGDFESFDHHIDAVLARGGAKAMVDEDMAAAAEDAGRRMLVAGERSRARRAFELAAALWNGLGDAAREREVRALMA